jgi:hypothetical protein
MNWKEDACVGVKRRKFGKFIGLRGCESPVVEKRPEVLKGDSVWERKWV